MNFKKDVTGVFWMVVLFLVILFVWGLCSSEKVFAHETHLSDVGVLRTITVEPCYGYGVYVIDSNERGCDVVYKHMDLSGHVGLHIEPWPLQDGDCVCLKGDSD